MNRLVRSINFICSKCLDALRLFFVTAALIGLSFGSVPLQAADVYWDPDNTAASNDLDGTNLGGAGTWDTVSSQWWDGVSANAAWTDGDTAIFSKPLALRFLYFLLVILMYIYPINSTDCVTDFLWILHFWLIDY